MKVRESERQTVSIPVPLRARRLTAVALEACRSRRATRRIAHMLLLGRRTQFPRSLNGRRQGDTLRPFGTRSGVRDYKCMRDLNFGAGCAPSLAQVTESVLALAAEQVRGEQQPGQLMPSAIGPQMGRLFLTADSLPRSIPARRLHPYRHRAPERFCNNRSCRAWRTSLRWSAAACRKPRSR